MDMLKKELAPLSTKVWQEIESRANEILRTRLAGRKAIRVVGPLGWNYTSVTEGRLDIVGDSGDVKTGVYRSTPLTEARVRFSLNRQTVLGKNTFYFFDADFEENTIYNGFKAGGIIGLKEAAVHKPISFGTDSSSIMEAIAKGVLLLQQESVDSPYALIVGPKAYLALSKEVQGLPLVERIEKLIKGKVIQSLTLEGALLVPYDNENLELVVGQDFAVGYETHDTKDVTLFITESFIFRVLDPNMIVPYTN